MLQLLCSQRGCGRRYDHRFRTGRRRGGRILQAGMCAKANEVPTKMCGLKREGTSTLLLLMQRRHSRPNGYAHPFLTELEGSAFRIIAAASITYFLSVRGRWVFGGGGRGLYSSVLRVSIRLRTRGAVLKREGSRCYRHSVALGDPCRPEDFWDCAFRARRPQTADPCAHTGLWESPPTGSAEQRRPVQTSDVIARGSLLAPRRRAAAPAIDRSPRGNREGFKAKALDRAREQTVVSRRASLSPSAFLGNVSRAEIRRNPLLGRSARVLDEKQTSSRPFLFSKVKRRAFAGVNNNDLPFVSWKAAVSAQKISARFADRVPPLPGGLSGPLNVRRTRLTGAPFLNPRACLDCGFRGRSCLRKGSVHAVLLPVRDRSTDLVEGANPGQSNYRGAASQVQFSSAAKPDGPVTRSGLRLLSRRMEARGQRISFSFPPRLKVTCEVEVDGEVVSRHAEWARIKAADVSTTVQKDTSRLELMAQAPAMDGIDARSSVPKALVLIPLVSPESERFRAEGRAGESPSAVPRQGRARPPFVLRQVASQHLKEALVSGAFVGFREWRPGPDACVPVCLNRAAGSRRGGPAAKIGRSVSVAPARPRAWRLPSNPGGLKQHGDGGSEVGNSLSARTLSEAVTAALLAMGPSGSAMVQLGFGVD
ncbi:hypothetical protein SKAU_G00314010 [Synaphobranchus kaupii]|uniref:Uncharacterized protein n=1 Tax=Synaphobranchus kaupii TaxID=118154 RepID=A0A9Q1ESC0_SYNKA|nr:hypothetical protein SKAU_G00314010 [Synaphobranchus kaupii]